MRYWMDVHNRDANNKTDFYHDNCSHVTYLEWDDSTRSSYVVDHPCVLFDVYWVPFGTNVHKYWLGMPCNTEHDFVCMKLMDELPCIHSCNESVYLAPKSDVECEAYCGQLLGCRHRFLTLDDFTVCHIIRSSFINDDPFYNICYLQDLYSYNVRYCDPPGSYNMSYTPNKEPNVTDLCAEPETTTEVIQTTTEVLTTLATTEGTTAKVSCECPCSVTVNITDSNLTLAEKVEQLKKELTVNKRNTSAHRRSKISMADHRVSATSIGSLGVVILSVVLGSICMLDLTRVRCDKIKRNCSKSKSKRIGDSKEVLPNIKLIKLETKSTPS
ncbi:uncharacterized protein LOC134262428 [Saccostrea cucullata]|uniref:uncharacterized protein LOC134262428 n=1 Tax=Saccostrea cuccullata TaxID=36930 RepID=UPI002ED3BFD4